MSGPRRHHGQTVVVVAAVACLLVLGLLPALLREPQTDESWPLYLAQRILEGKRQGVDFFEVNPPLYIWLCIPPVLVHQMTGFNLWQSWIVMVGMLAGLSCCLTAVQLPSLEPSLRHRIGMLLAAGFAVFVLPGIDFSEREHIALILVLPFVLLTARRAGSSERMGSTGLGIGLLGGVGFALKPHFVLTWLLLETWLAWRIRRATLQRPEAWAIIGFGATYFAAVVWLQPEYLSSAARLAPQYHVYLNNGLTGGLGMGGWFPLLIAAMALAIRTTARQGDDLRTAFTLAFLGFFAAAALQQKGFSYHYLTAMGFGVLLLARAWQTRPPSISWYPSGILVRLGFLLLLMILVQKTSAALQDLSEPHHRRYRPDPEYGELLRTTKQLAEGNPIMVLSTNPVHGWPLTLSANVSWASRYMHLWPMAAFYHEQLWRFPPRMVQPRPLEERSAAERRFHDEVIEDLERGSPRLLLVVTPDSSQWGLGGARRFDYLKYFGVDPRFQNFMKDYQELPRLGSYRLWLRTSQ